MFSIFKSKKPKWYKVFDTLEEAEKVVAVNKAVTVQIEQDKICLARTAKGFFAVQDTCPHLGVSLSKGVCNNFNEVVCPWHGWRFDLEKGHETSGQGKGAGVVTYPVKVDDEGLSIGVYV
jgi:nitrite reductase/ring-hydroxylating ferredoxin subunit